MKNLKRQESTQGDNPRNPVVVLETSDDPYGDEEEGNKEVERNQTHLPKENRGFLEQVVNRLLTARIPKGKKGLELVAKKSPPTKF